MRIITRLAAVVTVISSTLLLQEQFCQAIVLESQTAAATAVSSDFTPLVLERPPDFKGDVVPGQRWVGSQYFGEGCPLPPPETEKKAEKSEDAKDQSRVQLVKDTNQEKETEQSNQYCKDENENGFCDLGEKVCLDEN